MYNSQFSYPANYDVLPVNGQSYGQALGYSGTNLGTISNPPAYTQTREFRRAENRALKGEKRAERRERKAARKSGRANSYSTGSAGGYQSYAPGVSALYPVIVEAPITGPVGYPAGLQIPPSRVSYGSPAQYGSQYFGGSGVQQQQYPAGQFGQQFQVPGQSLYSPQSFGQQPMLPIQQGFNSYNHGFPGQSLGSSYGLGASPYQSAFNQVGQADWARNSVYN